MFFAVRVLAFVVVGNLSSLAAMSGWVFFNSCASLMTRQLRDIALVHKLQLYLLHINICPLNSISMPDQCGG
jgi:hypothetical protein